MCPWHYEPVTVDSAAALRLIAESLGFVDRLGARPIHVRDVRMADRTLVVEIDVRSADPAAVRGEIVGVMGALSGLDVPGLFPVLEAQSFGVRAFDASGQELLWIVSSIEAAGFAARGQPIEWLARSLVQENTPAYRRSQADHTIGQVETALRDMMDHHALRHAGEHYVDRLWAAPAVGEMRDQARAEGHSASDSRTILDYAYLPQLRDGIASHMEWFDDGCLPESNAFEESVTRLNRVRRKVAHHRPISDEDLRVCKGEAHALLRPVGRAHPELAADFLVDRWEEQVAETITAAQQAIQSPSVPDLGTVSETERRRAAVDGLRAQLTGIEAALAALDRLVVPAQRSELHDTAVAALSRWRDALAELVAIAERPDLAPSEAEAAHAAYQAALGEVHELGRAIQGLRVGMPAAAGQPPVEPSRGQR
jgi:hypothetical protein